MLSTQSLLVAISLCAPANGHASVGEGPVPVQETAAPDSSGDASMSAEGWTLRSKRERRGVGLLAGGITLASVGTVLVGGGLGSLVFGSGVGDSSGGSVTFSLALAGAGLGLVGASVPLLYFGHRRWTRWRQRHETTPTLGWSTSTLQLGFSGRF